MACMRWWVPGLVFLAVIGAGAWLLLLLALAAGLWWVAGGVARQSAGGRTMSPSAAEVADLRGRVANQLLDLEDRVRFADAPTRERFRRAGSLYIRASDDLDHGRGRRARDGAHADLRRARYELEATGALLEGRPPPRRTKPLQLVWLGPRPQWRRASCARW